MAERFRSIFGRFFPVSLQSVLEAQLPFTNLESATALLSYRLHLNPSSQSFQAYEGHLKLHR